MWFLLSKYTQSIRKTTFPKPELQDLHYSFPFSNLYVTSIGIDDPMGYITAQIGPDTKSSVEPILPLLLQSLDCYRWQKLESN